MFICVFLLHESFGVLQYSGSEQLGDSYEADPIHLHDLIVDSNTGKNDWLIIFNLVSKWSIN